MTSVLIIGGGGMIGASRYSTFISLRLLEWALDSSGFIEPISTQVDFGDKFSRNFLSL